MSRKTEDEACECGGLMEWSDYCGAKVCNDCGRHKGLTRCYCGWSESGGNGRSELTEMGENIDGEFDPADWA